MMSSYFQSEEHRWSLVPDEDQARSKTALIQQSIEQPSTNTNQWMKIPTFAPQVLLCNTFLFFFIKGTKSLKLKVTLYKNTGRLLYLNRF